MYPTGTQVTDSNAAFQITMTPANSPSSPGTAFTLNRVSPAPVAVVRRGEGVQTVEYVRVPETTHLVLRADASKVGQKCPESTLLLQVRPRIEISATRTGVRTYAFFGRVTPGRGQDVTLYRKPNGAGADVVTARAHVQPDGTYRISRKFLASGRFGFYVAVDESQTNLSGASRVRDTLIY